MKTLFLAIVLAGCASSPQPAPNASNGERRFANREECDTLVDHIDDIRYRSEPPLPPRVRSGEYRPGGPSPEFHRARVDDCTVGVDQRELACLTAASDTTEALRCHSRFFAQTLESYRR
jgi:hypothetical protein